MATPPFSFSSTAPHLPQVSTIACPTIYAAATIATGKVISTAPVACLNAKGVFYLRGHIDLHKVTTLIVGLVFCKVGTVFYPLAGGLALWTSQPSLEY